MIEYKKINKLMKNIPEKDQLTTDEIFENSEGKFELIYSGFKLGFYKGINSQNNSI